MLFLDRDIRSVLIGEGVNLIEYAHRKAVVPLNDAQKAPSEHVAPQVTRDERT